MAESVVAFLLNQLSSIVYQGYTHLGGLQQDVRYIKDELGSIRAFLRDVEAKDDSDFDFELQEWVKQVREVAYDTEDAIEEFTLSSADRQAGGFYGSTQKIYTSIKNLRARHKISSKLKDIKCRVEYISARHRRYHSVYGTSEGGPSSASGEYAVCRIRGHALLLEEANLVGIDEPKSQLAFQEIQKEVPLEVEFMDSDGLRAFVKSFLKERGYIIVLDDIWSMDAWDSIKYAMPDSNCSSRVIVTTRIADIAYACCKECQGYVHHMKPLSVEESWTLFCNKTFEEKQCPSHLEKISRSILSKCQGLPLAIVAIGGLLALKDTRKLDEWEMVCRSLGSELEGTGKLDRVRKILLLSYNDLRYFLKSCLLYISIYPEDYQIHAWKLVRLWIAEGFVQERPGMTSIEVAKSYLNELINRSLIQVAATHADGTVQSCRVHDLLREIILFKSREHNITTVATGWYPRWPDSVRRLAIYDFIDDQQDPMHPVHLRSLVISKYRNPLTSSSLSRFLKGGSKLLKVMDLRGAELKNIPEELFKLFHLKYLNLADTGIEIIPKAIGKLQNLEFLNLVGTGVKELPIDILKLRKLRDLLVYKQGNYSESFAVHGFNAPYEIGGLLSLQYLHFIDADNEKTVKEIGKLTQLRELGITKLRREDGKDFCSSLEKLTNLQRLVVNSISENEVLNLQFSMSTSPQLLQLLELRGCLEKIPQWLPCLQGLTVVYLYWSSLREDPLETLQDLPNLIEIILYQAYEGEALCFKAGKFQKLKILELRKLKGLRMVRFEEGTMPHLNKLYMDDCRLVEKLPEDMQCLKELEFLGLYDMANELIRKLQNLDRNDEDYRKIAHITQIFVGYWSNGQFVVPFRHFALQHS